MDKFFFKELIITTVSIVGISFLSFSLGFNIGNKIGIEDGFSAGLQVNNILNDLKYQSTSK